MTAQYKLHLNQNYDEIFTNCLKNNRLFEDSHFPADDTSIYRISKPNKTIFWKRPHEICENPQFIVDGINPADLDQGQLGNCWVISAAAALVSVPDYLNKVIPVNQTFDKENYVGVFKFHFWNFGEWIEVVIDDRLPVDEDNDLIYCHNNKEKNEFFGPLLEKAYAKLNSCYEFLEGGEPIDAMIDLTGGIHETFTIKKISNRIVIETETVEEDKDNSIDLIRVWDMIFKSFHKKSLCATSIDAGDKSPETVEESGLVLGHAYTILNAYELFPHNKIYSMTRRPNEDSRNGSVKLLKMRNPWGRNKCWNGSWSYTSDEWKRVTDDIKNEIQYENQTDGEFFISFQDFIKIFDYLEFVHVNLNAYFDSNDSCFPSVRWRCQQFYGSWRKGVNSGGCGNDGIENYWLNPQYQIDLTLKNNQDEFVSIIVSLYQKPIGPKTSKKLQIEPLGITVFRVKSNEKKTNQKYNPNDLEEIDTTGTYLKQNEITKRFNLLPGAYVLIPSTFNKDVDMNFLLRVFIESEEITENSENEIISSLDHPVDNIWQIPGTAKIKTDNSPNTYNNTYKKSYKNVSEEPRGVLTYTKNIDNEPSEQAKDSIIDVGGRIASKTCDIM